jgi:hypothetical protein
MIIEETLSSRIGPFFGIKPGEEDLSENF